MRILLAILAHDRHGTVRVRVAAEKDAQRWLHHGWRLIGFEVYVPRAHAR